MSDDMTWKNVFLLVPTIMKVVGLFLNFLKMLGIKSKC